MPTDISNAVGTARQFTPQPDGVYQGRYQGLGVSQGSAAQPKVVDVAESMAKLSDALQSYTVNHEKYLNTKGEIEATDMVNGMSAGAIEKLNAIDAAQLEGYADSAANPYFTAYAEKLRGSFLGARMKQDYDAKYAMEPAKSAEEELKRYANFMNEWRDAHLKNATPRNQLAFDRGFYENSMVNMGNLATSWNKKKHEEDVVVTMANMQSELGDVIKNSVDLLKTNGAMTERVQAIFNEGRLMGLPPQYRQKILEDFTQEILKTGRIPADRLAQMLESVTIQTSMDGTTIKASDLLDMQSVKTIASQYNRQFITQEKYDWVEKFRKRGESGYKDAIAEVTKLRETDPEKALEYNSLLPELRSKIDHDIAEKKALARQVARSKLGGGSGGSSTGGSNGGLKDPEKIKRIIEAWSAGDTMCDGIAINSYTFNKDTMYPIVWNELGYFAQNNNPDAFFRLLDMKQLGDIKSTIAADMSSKLASIKPTDDGGVNIGGDPIMMSLVQMITSNPNNVEHSLGADVAKQARFLKSLVDVSGDFNNGLRMFANYNNADPEVVAQNKKLVEEQMNGYTIEGVRHLDSVYSNGSYDTVRFDSNMNSDLRSEIIDLATAYTTCGYTPYDAINKAGSDVVDNFQTYHWGAFPKAVYNNLGTPDDEGYFSHALDRLCYSAAGDGNPADSVHISYNRYTQMFYAVDWSNDGGHAEMSLAEARSIAKQDYEDAVKYMAEHPNAMSSSDSNSSDNNYDASADSINEERSNGNTVSSVVENNSIIGSAIGAGRLLKKGIESLLSW